MRRHRHHELAGTRFGKLTVLHPTDAPAGISGRAQYWLCQCDCGKQIRTATRTLNAGKSQSCGCSKPAAARRIVAQYVVTHGQSKTREYRIWAGMINRCENASCRAFKYYGKRGITVCASWRASFEPFLSDMGRAPTSKHSIDRINNDGNYEPGNCRWATMQEQALNKSNVQKVNSSTFVEMARAAHINPATARSRIKRKGWPIQQAIETPLDRRPLLNRVDRHPRAKLTNDQIRAIRASHGVRSSIAIAKEYGISQAQAWGIQRRRSWRHVPE